MKKQLNRFGNFISITLGWCFGGSYFDEKEADQEFQQKEIIMEPISLEMESDLTDSIESGDSICESAQLVSDFEDLLAVEGN